MIEYWLALIGSVVVASISQMLLKKAALIEYENHIKEYINVWVITGYFFMFLSTMLSIFAFTKLEYKNGAIIDSLGYVLVMILGRAIYKENITRNKIIGIIIILLGILIFYI